MKNQGFTTFTQRADNLLLPDAKPVTDGALIASCDFTLPRGTALKRTSGHTYQPFDATEDTVIDAILADEMEYSEDSERRATVYLSGAFDKTSVYAVGDTPPEDGDALGGEDGQSDLIADAAAYEAIYAASANRGIVLKSTH